MLLMLAVLAAAAAAAVALPDDRRRLDEVIARPPGSRVRGGGLADPRVTRGVSLLLAVVLVITLGGIVGVVAGVATAMGLPRLLSRLETSAQRERRTAVARQSADAIDLLTACLASGAPVTMSLRAVSRAIGPPLGDPLHALVASLDLGADPVAAWRDFGSDPALAPLARTMTRSLESGAPLREVLPGLADDLRRASRSAAETAARSAGVRAVGPLAACYLPAFVLLGVVPVVASLALPLLQR